MPRWSPGYRSADIITGFIINILFTDENNSFFTVGKTFIYRETSLEKQSWKGDWKGNGGQVEGALCCRRLGVFEVSAAFWFSSVWSGSEHCMGIVQLLRCGNVNWARRKTCNVCNAPKLADLEKRTGMLRFSVVLRYLELKRAETIFVVRLWWRFQRPTRHRVCETRHGGWIRRVW